MKKLIQSMMYATITSSLLLSTPLLAGEKHPRRKEVVDRADHQEKTVDDAATSGKITQQQEQKLDAKDEAVKAEEEKQAAANGGHITKGEQRRDNRREDRIHRQLKRDEKKDASAPVAEPAK